MRLPEDTIAIPILGAETALSVCVLVSASRGGEASLRPVRTTSEAIIYPGCLRDGLGEVREWLEVWVQTPPSAGLLAEANNALLDSRWRVAAGVRHELEGERTIGGDWERVHPAPTVLDLEARAAVVLGSGEEGGPWAVCTDDAALDRAGLPRYSSTVARCLWRPSSGGEGRIVQIAGEGAASWRGLAPGAPGAIPFNPHGGLLFVRRMAPVSLESYIDWLSQGRFHTPPRERGPTGEREGRTNDPSEVALAHGGFMPSIGGSAGLLAEVLYLKLRAIVSAVRSVRTATERLDAPLLSLGSQSFGVEMPEADAGLPYAWGARVVLDVATEARELASVDRAAPRSFTYVRAGETGVYRPGGDAGPIARMMVVRIKRIVQIEPGRVSVEGTVVPREAVRTGAGTLATIPLAIPGGRIEVHAHLTRSEALSQGEHGFTSLPLPVTDEQLAELRRLEGVELGDAPVVVSPSLSSPADLHALGVLAIRTLVAGSPDALGRAVVTAMSLAQELPDAGEGGPSVTARVAAVAEGDERWGDVLGPGRLVRDPELSQVVDQAIPGRLWWSIVGTVCRMFPGAGSDSYCSGFGVGAGRPLASVYDAPLADLGRHLHEVRSLLIVDRRTCEEVGSIVDRQLSLVSPNG